MNAAIFRRLAMIVTSVAIAACTSIPAGTPRPNSVIGLASCDTADMPYCQQLAGRTHLSGGPTQVEYIGPDGSLHLWIGNRITKGYWQIGHGLLGTVSMCYHYDRGYNCELLRSELSMKDATVDGDPLNLSSRAEPPFRLGVIDRRSLPELIAASTPASPLPLAQNGPAARSM